jgi:hypothetical protein
MAYGGTQQMKHKQVEHMGTGTRATDPELDEALARAIRRLIAGVIERREAVGADSASTAA